MWRSSNKHAGSESGGVSSGVDGIADTGALRKAMHRAEMAAKDVAEIKSKLQQPLNLRSTDAAVGAHRPEEEANSDIVKRLRKLLDAEFPDPEAFRRMTSRIAAALLITGGAGYYAWTRPTFPIPDKLWSRDIELFEIWFLDTCLLKIKVSSDTKNLPQYDLRTLARSKSTANGFQEDEIFLNAAWHSLVKKYPARVNKKSSGGASAYDTFISRCSVHVRQWKSSSSWLMGGNEAAHRALLAASWAGMTVCLVTIPARYVAQIFRSSTPFPDLVNQVDHRLFQIVPHLVSLGLPVRRNFLEEENNEDPLTVEWNPAIMYTGMPFAIGNIQMQSRFFSNFYLDFDPIAPARFMQAVLDNQYDCTVAHNDGYGFIFKKESHAFITHLLSQMDSRFNSGEKIQMTLSPSLPKVSLDLRQEFPALPAAISAFDITPEMLGTCPTLLLIPIVLAAFNVNNRDTYMITEVTLTGCHEEKLGRYFFDASKRITVRRSYVDHV